MWNKIFLFHHQENKMNICMHRLKCLNMNAIFVKVWTSLYIDNAESVISFE